MAEGIGIIANVAVAALTGKRGITLFRTGRRRYGFCVYMLMFLPRDFTGFFFTAAFAASLFQSCFVFRCFLHCFPFAEFMTERFRIITGITVATLLTGIGRIAFFRTGGVCDNLVIFMVADSYLYVTEGSHAVCGYLNVCFAVILRRQHTVSYGYYLGIGRSIA